MSSYCAFVRSGEAHPVHVVYHDTEYGFPLTDDNRLFERLVLEINQAGLSWETILKKQDGFRHAYDGFDIATVAAYTDEDVTRLLGNPAIIRNRLKVQAAVYNAGVIEQLRHTHGSFAGWLSAHAHLDKAEWTALFKKHFRFTGGEIVGEFLMSCGLLPGAHDPDCPVLAQIASRHTRSNAARATNTTGP